MEGTNPGDYNDQISDEKFYATVAIHDPLWRYIITRYTEEAYGKSKAVINILGYRTLPVAIELSQWGYDITVLLDRPEELKRAKRDYEIQAGFIDKNLAFQYRYNVPQATVTCFIGVIHELSPERTEDFLDMLLRRSREVVCAVPNDREWGEFLDGKYEFNIIPYPSGLTCLLSIKRLSD